MQTTFLYLCLLCSPINEALINLMSIINIFFLYCLGDASGCGVTDKVIEWMDRIQNSANEDKSIESRQLSNKFETPGHKYSKEANLPINKTSRIKRSTRPKEDSHNKNTCSLFIQTDPLIWRHMFEQVMFDTKFFY